MKILVTGSEGYIGLPLTHALRKAGHVVVGLDTCFYQNGWLYDGIKPLAHIVKKDIRHVLEKDLEGFDAICHLAELSNDPLGESNTDITYEINHLATVELAKKAKKVGVKRFIYMSSCSVYGASDEIRDEESSVNPLTAYAKCKVLNEKALLDLGDSNFSPVILRNATVFGPSPRMRFDLVVNNLSGLAYTQRQIKMDSDGTPWRPLIHVDDLSRLILYILESDRKITHGQILNVGDNSSNYQIKDIATIISSIFVGCEISLNKDGGDKRNYRVNFDKLKRILPNFSCQKDVKKGVKELFDIFTRVHLTKKDFESAKYTRLKQIKHLRDTKQIDEKFFWI
ncbi:SDR family oxidoreductase [Candidatus Gottesmanbacteria bacterium]|nr:SDR family oxidoreductase [Candidatus Gottesmanbacteria bacterium]